MQGAFLSLCYTLSRLRFWIIDLFNFMYINSSTDIFCDEYNQNKNSTTWYSFWFTQQRYCSEKTWMNVMTKHVFIQRTKNVNLQTKRFKPTKRMPFFVKIFFVRLVKINNTLRWFFLEIKCNNIALLYKQQVLWIGITIHWLWCDD